MAIAPKRRRIRTIIIIILGRVIADLDSDIDSGINFDMEATFDCGEMVTLMNKDETTWDGAEDAVYAAADHLGDVLEGNAEVGQEPEPATAYAALEAAIGNL
jgi:hypothetical protein